MAILRPEKGMKDMIPTLLADHEETRADSLLWRIMRGTLFQLSAENAHNLAMMGLQQWQNLGAHRPLMPHWTRHPTLQVRRWGLDFP